jgi:hypothetical protein
MAGELIGGFIWRPFVVFFAVLAAADLAGWFAR